MALEGGLPVGVMMLYEPQGKLGVFVDPKFRQRGIGSVLFSEGHTLTRTGDRVPRRYRYLRLSRRGPR